MRIALDPVRPEAKLAVQECLKSWYKAGLGHGRPLEDRGERRSSDRDSRE